MKTIYDHYLISEQGEVFRKLKTGNIRAVKPYKHKSQANKYPRVTLSVNGDKIRKFVHEFVALAYIGPKPKGKQVNHKDLNTFNNSPNNLEYVTPRQNKLHSLNFKQRK